MISIRVIQVPPWLLQEVMSLLRGAPLPLDRVQGLSGCGLLQHRDTIERTRQLTLVRLAARKTRKIVITIIIIIRSMIMFIINNTITMTSIISSFISIALAVPLSPPLEPSLRPLPASDMICNYMI